MKNLIFLFSFLTISIIVNAQNETIKSDLKIKVDSIIEYQFGSQVINLADFVHVSCIKASKESTSIVRSTSIDTMPMLILDNRLIELDELNSYSLKDLSEFHVYNKGDINIIKSYGTRAFNGVIIMESKKKRRRKRKKH